MINWQQKPKTNRSNLLNVVPTRSPTIQELNEEHHRVYGRPWCLGKIYMNILISLGITRDDKVLDFGCGCGRVGVELLQYLNKDRYFGVDADLEGLDVFLNYEIPNVHIDHTSFFIAHDSTLDFEIFGEKFDYIIDLFASAHLQKNDLLRFAQACKVNLKKGGKLVVTPRSHLKDILEAEGFVCILEQNISHPLLNELKPTHQFSEIGIYSFSS